MGARKQPAQIFAVEFSHVTPLRTVAYPAGAAVPADALEAATAAGVVADAPAEPETEEPGGQ